MLLHGVTFCNGAVTRCFGLGPNPDGDIEVAPRLFQFGTQSDRIFNLPAAIGIDQPACNLDFGPQAVELLTNRLLFRNGVIPFACQHPQPAFLFLDNRIQLGFLCARHLQLGGIALPLLPDGALGLLARLCQFLAHGGKLVLDMGMRFQHILQPGAFVIARCVLCLRQHTLLV